MVKSKRDYLMSWIGTLVFILAVLGLMRLVEYTGWSDATLQLHTVVVEPTPTTTASPTTTATPTATATPVMVWQDHFNGSAGSQPTNWEDETQNSGFNAEINYSYIASYAAVTRTVDDTWGRCLSPNVTCDVEAFPLIWVNVTTVSPSTSWKLGIQETEGTWAYRDISSSTTSTGIFVINYRDIMNGVWTVGGNTHRFSIQVVVEGGGGTYIEMDELRVYR